MDRRPFLLALALMTCALMLSACTPVATTNNLSNVTIPMDNAVISAPANNSQAPTEAPVETAPPSGNFAAKLTYTEGDLITLKTLATDPDTGDKVTLTFSKPFTARGTWQTRAGDAGDYPVTITATDSHGAASSERILVTVKAALKAPVISGPDSIKVQEGDTIKLSFSASSPQGSDVVLSYSGWMKGDTKQTGYGDAGMYNVTVTASDGSLVSKKVVPITVVHTNRAPTLSFSQGTYTVVEGQTVQVKPITSDADGDRVTVTYSKPLDNAGSWTTAAGDAGTYGIDVTASDGQSTTTQTAHITVTAAPKAPVITVPGSDGLLHAKEGDFLDLGKMLSITSPDNRVLTVTYSGWFSRATHQTTYDDAGNHVVTVTARDDRGLSTSQDVTIVIEDVNRPPVFVNTA